MKDMLRKLSTVVVGAEGSAYDSTCLILTNWSRGKARLIQTDVPDDLTVDRSFERCSLLSSAGRRSPTIGRRASYSAATSPITSRAKAWERSIKSA